MRRPEIPPWRRVVTPVALAFVSLLTALILWIAVTDAENPQTTRQYPGRVEIQAVNVPAGLAVRNIEPATVELVVSADEDDFERLTLADFQVQVDLTNATADTVDGTITAKIIGDVNAEVRSFSPGIVRVTLEQVATKQVPVVPRPIGELPQGFFLPSVPEANPTIVQVTGAASLVAQVQVVSADVNLTGRRATVTQEAVLTARDARNTEIPRILIEPARVDLRIVVAQQEVTVPVQIVASLQGNLADGYNVVGVTIDPIVVPVSGTLEATQSLATISTEPVDVSGLKTDLSRTVRLRLPAGVTTTRDTVNVRIRIAPAPGEILLNVAPQVTGLGDGLSVTVQTQSVALRLTGDLPTLKGLTPGAVRATVNASGLTEGPHVLDPQITVPTGVQVASIDPSQVVIVIRR